MRTNYHTHNQLCDGRGTPADYTDAAVDRGFDALGFSSHAPLPVANDWALPAEALPDYLNAVNNEKSRRAGTIQIYTGLEIDYIPGTQTPRDAVFQSMNLDYCIASVHSTDPLETNPDYACVDGPVENLKWLLQERYGNSFENLSQAYYRRIDELVRLGGFNIVAHFDLIKKHNTNRDWFDPDSRWYRSQVLTALDSLAGNGIILEVNTGGISRGYLDEPYPSPWILKEAFKREIPVTISSDAHDPADIDCHFDESETLLRETGYREICILFDGVWQAVAL